MNIDLPVPSSTETVTSSTGKSIVDIYFPKPISQADGYNIDTRRHFQNGTARAIEYRDWETKPVIVFGRSLSMDLPRRAINASGVEFFYKMLIFHEAPRLRSYCTL